MNFDQLLEKVRNLKDKFDSGQLSDSQTMRQLEALQHAYLENEDENSDIGERELLKRLRRKIRKQNEVVKKLEIDNFVLKLNLDIDFSG
ncbi:hypothetical protein ACFQ1M_09865 [Sungkyunkwania multivorans]|uniref:Uncharacterized protein n=1 Tax=Sungkyunkwania multivorans TaxID=1173618 RepID=A0ABW3CZ74_9FLAO